MDDRAAREVERAAGDRMVAAEVQNSLTPDPVAERAVEERSSQDEEDDHG